MARKSKQVQQVGVTTPLSAGGFIQPTLTDDVLQIALSGEVLAAIEKKSGSVLLTVRRSDLRRCICTCANQNGECATTVPIEAALRAQVKEVVPNV